MKELHEKPYILGQEPRLLPDDTIDVLKEVAVVLKKIHLRMIEEGYEMIDGKIKKVASSQ